jgi:hypothetical protein
MSIQGKTPTFSRLQIQPFTNLHLSTALCAVLLMLVAPSSSWAQTPEDVFAFSYSAGVGDAPIVPLIAGPHGALYGTTTVGGDVKCNDGAGCGTVFALTQLDGKWTHNTLYEFKGGKDGVQSISTLALDKTGSLYGVTDSGTPDGAVYRLTPGASSDEPWNFGLIYEFTGKNDGAWALSPLLLHNGAIYGATLWGGLHGKGCDQQFGCGAVFQLVPPSEAGGTWTETTLYDFKGTSDGGNPSSLVMDSTGTIYGMTSSGGVFSSKCYLGCGVVFKLVPENGSWGYSVIYSFNGEPDEVPYGSLIIDSSGDLYGLVGNGYQGDSGSAIFKLTPPSSGSDSWTLQNIHEHRGLYPASNLTLSSDGVFYGDVYGDEDFNSGYLFQLTPPQTGDKWTYSNLVNFNKTAYQNPQGVLVLDDNLFVTITGGGYVPGNIVSVKLSAF